MVAHSKVNIASLTPHPIPKIGESRVLSLDLGRRTGMCLGYKGQVIDSGVHELYSQTDREFTDSQRFLAFYQLLLKFMDVDVVVFEAVGGGTKGRQTVLWNGYRATLLLWAQMMGKPVVPLSVGSIKKELAGKGNASKEEMIEACRTRGVVPFDDNEADACGAFWAACAIDSAPREEYSPSRIGKKVQANGKASRTRRGGGKRKVNGSGDAPKKRVRKTANGSAAKKDAASGSGAERRGSKRTSKGTSKPRAPRKNA